MDSNHSPTKKEKASTALRLAEGSWSNDENSNNLSGTSPQDSGPELDSPQSSTRQRASVNARAKLDGSKAKHQPSNKSPTLKILKKGEEDQAQGDGVIGDLDDCMPSRQGTVPVTFLLTKKPTHEESQYTTREEAEPGAIYVSPGEGPESQYTTTEEAEPGAIHVSAGGVESSSDLGSVESLQPDDPLVSAIKVPDGGDDADAVRIAKKEAETLRQQVQNLQDERHNIPVATARTDEEETKKESNWIPCAAIGSVIIGGIIVWAVSGGTQQEPVKAPTDAPTSSVAPTVTPTPAPTLFPCLEEIVIATSANETNTTILQLCQGDCDQDKDCGAGLICFHRSWEYAPVPGCSCWETDDTRNDYCIEPPTEPCLVETNDYPLGLCEGNCQNDDDCQEGFDCYLTWTESWLVPGCLRCPQDFEDDSPRLLAGHFNTTPSGFCSKEETVAPVPTAPTPFPSQAVAAGTNGFASLMHYSVILLSLFITPLSVLW